MCGEDVVVMHVGTSVLKRPGMLRLGSEHVMKRCEKLQLEEAMSRVLVDEDVAREM
jgi:hypothetical protein